MSFIPSSLIPPDKVYAGTMVIALLLLYASLIEILKLTKAILENFNKV